MARRTLWEWLHGGFQEPRCRVLLQGAADWVEVCRGFFEEIVDVDAGGVDGMLRVDAESCRVGCDGGGELESGGGRIY